MADKRRIAAEIKRQGGEPSPQHIDNVAELMRQIDALAAETGLSRAILLAKLRSATNGR